MPGKSLTVEPQPQVQNILLVLVILFLVLIGHAWFQAPQKAEGKSEREHPGIRLLEQYV